MIIQEISLSQSLMETMTIIAMIITFQEYYDHDKSSLYLDIEINHDNHFSRVLWPLSEKTTSSRQVSVYMESSSKRIIKVDQEDKVL